MQVCRLCEKVVEFSPGPCLDCATIIHLEAGTIFTIKLHPADQGVRVRIIKILDEGVLARHAEISRFEANPEPFTIYFGQGFIWE